MITTPGGQPLVSPEPDERSPENIVVEVKEGDLVSRDRLAVLLVDPESVLVGRERKEDGVTVYRFFRARGKVKVFEGKENPVPAPLR